jgi:uncharacterized protein YfaS (alpha-2-macroglobulin family)
LVSLPPEVHAKLPDVLSKGLERLYNFQHADGGWGWWEKDATNDGMTVYVVYGLARCKAAGTQIDGNVLARGCDYLRKRIAEGQPLGAGMEGPDLIARACLAMALAGRTDKAGVENYAKAALAKKDNFEARCNLALACREVGLHELGRRLWQGASAWEPAETSQLALKLSTQVAFGEELGACRLTAAKLLAKRSGLYWDHTRNTSWAIEALAAMLRYDLARADGAKRVAVLLGGKAAMDLHDAKDLAQRSHYLHLLGAGLPAGDAMPIEMIVDSKEPASYLVQATGIQRQDTVEATGKEVRLTRRYTDLDGKDIVGSVKVGQVIAARLTLELDRAMDRLIVEDRRPAGLEFADDRLDGAAAGKSVNVEFRDDRVCAFFGNLEAGKHEVVYYLRAETAGVSQVLPGSAYPMYNDRLRGSTASAKLEVVRP